MIKITDYLKKYGEKTIEEYPHNEIDSAIYCIFSYADFLNSELDEINNIFNSFIPVTIFNNDEIINKLSKKYLLPQELEKFLKLFLNAKRYEDLEVGYVDEEINESSEVQYFAMTFKFKDRYIIAFRGTDNTIVGWKEDFNMAVKDEIPSHEKCLNYVNKMLEILDGRSIYIIGHSKGGNLSYYSYLNLEENLKPRISKVYNFDGPGFKDDEKYKDIYDDKMVKYVPKDDLVGIIFDTSRRWKIVSTYGRGAFAHDIMTWLIDENYKEFESNKEFYVSTEALMIAFNHWIKNISYQTRSEVIGFLFDVLYSNDSSTLGQMLFSAYNKTNKYINKIQNYDTRIKKKVRQVVKNFFLMFSYIYLHLGEFQYHHDRLETNPYILNLVKKSKEIDK